MWQMMCCWMWYAAQCYALGVLWYQLMLSVSLQLCTLLCAWCVYACLCGPLQIRGVMLQGRSVAQELVAERARVVFTALEVLHPQFPQD